MSRLFKSEKKEKAKNYFLNGTKEFYKSDNKTLPITVYIMLTSVLSESVNMPQLISGVVDELEKFTRDGFIAPQDMGEFITYTWTSLKIEHDGGDKFYSFLFVSEKQYQDTVMDVLFDESHRDSKNNIHILQSVFK